MASLLKPLVVVAMVALTSTAAQASCAVKKVPGSQAVIKSSQPNQALFSSAVIAEMNCFRQAKGLHSLKKDPQITKVARTHSRWMAKARRMSHKSSVSGQSTLKGRLRRAGYQPQAGSENVAFIGLPWTSTSCAGLPAKASSYAGLAQRVVQMWKESAGHRRNMLNRHVTHAGAAFAIETGSSKCGTIYMTLDLAR